MLNEEPIGGVKADIQCWQKKKRKSGNYNTVCFNVTGIEGKRLDITADKSREIAIGRREIILSFGRESSRIRHSRRRSLLIATR